MPRMNEVPFTNIVTFLKVVDSGSFSAAARELGVTQSTASRRVVELERRLDVRLIERTTRLQLLTEAGARYAEKVRAIIVELTEAEAELSQHRLDAQGPLRVSISSGFGRLAILPALLEFVRSKPLVQLDIDLSDRYVDILNEDFDLAIRLRPPETTGLQGAALGPRINLWLCASPDFLNTNPIADSADLTDRRCIVQRTYAPRIVWDFTEAGTQKRLSIQPRIVINEIEAIHQAARVGIGAAILPEFMVSDDVSKGHLIRILPNLEFPDFQFHMVWPSHKEALSRLRILRNHLAQKFL